MKNIAQLSVQCKAPRVPDLVNVHATNSTWFVSRRPINSDEIMIYKVENT